MASWMKKRKEFGTGSFGLLPIGDYVLEIKGAEVKPTKAGNGEILKLELEVVSDFRKGAKVFENLNVSNPNTTAERIGLERLNQIIEFSGLDDPEDPEELIGEVVGARVTVEPARNGYDARSKVSYYKEPEKCDLDESSYEDAEGGSAGASGGAGKKSQKPAGSGGGKKPWER